MACISYNTPLLDHKSGASLNNFIDVIDVNLKEAGLIRTALTPGELFTDSYISNQLLDFDPATFTNYYNSLAIKNGTAWYQTQYICTLKYKLPTGNGKIIFVDDEENNGYKKIEKASYDSTEVFIQFDFVLNTMITSSSNTLNTRFILCHVSIRTKENLVIARVGTGYLLYPEYGTSNNIYCTMEGKSFISLTQNSLSIVIGCHYLAGFYAHNNNNYRKYMINFSLYRKNDNIYIYGIGHGASNNSTWYDYYNDDRSDIIQWSYNSLNNKTTSWYNRDGQFLYWPFGTAVPAEVASTIISGKTYAITEFQSVQHIPEFITTRLMETNTREIQLVYRLNNNLVIGNYVNLGLTERAQCPVQRSSKNYSWAFLFEKNINYTTELL